MTTQWAETSMAGGKHQRCSQGKEAPIPSSLDSVLGAHPPVGQECVGPDHSVRYLTGPIWAPSRQTAGGWEHRMPALQGGGEKPQQKMFPSSLRRLPASRRQSEAVLAGGDFSVLPTSLLGNEQLCLGCVPGRLAVWYHILKDPRAGPCPSQPIFFTFHWPYAHLRTLKPYHLADWIFAPICNLNR